MIADLPVDEDSRLRALAETGLLDTPPEPDFDEIVALAALICEVPIGTITLVDERRQWFKAAVGLPLGENPRDVSFCSHAILQPGLFIVPDATLDPRFASNPLVTGDPYIRFYAGVPLTVEGQNLGTLCVIDRQSRTLTPLQRSALNTLARQVTAQIVLRGRVRALQHAVEQRDSITLELRQSQSDLKRANALLQSLAVTDSLTGLKNRRSLEEHLQRELHVAARTGSPLSLLLLDVDYFKAVNDTHGHVAGDEALKALSRVLEKLFRRSDFVARYGGEEFAVILPNTAAASALQLARKVCSGIAAAPLRVQCPSMRDLPVTVSIGVATMVPDVSTPRDLIKLADEGLYLAKRAGRNRCAAVP